MNDNHDNVPPDRQCVPEAQEGSAVRTLMLRVKSKTDNTRLLERVVELGGHVVSQGKGVIVIEADTQAADALSEDEDVLAVSEERKLEMRMPSMTLKND